MNNTIKVKEHNVTYKKVQREGSKFHLRNRWPETQTYEGFPVSVVRKIVVSFISL